VEVFDEHEVSFVSVTQQFNTTTSMGRLTLNVLLSFAQFEREVTGERIRDKFAASRKKGMWMGGTVPLGYDVENRKLVINETEAEQVRTTFRLYLELGCEGKLQEELTRRGYRSKRRMKKDGTEWGGCVFSPGALYSILKNRTYIGEVTHKGNVYPGEHDAIVDRELWDRVQKQLAENRQGHRTRATAKEPSLLTGLLYDERGNRMTPSHAIKNGKRYRYYQGPKKGGRRAGRIPAHDVEQIVIGRLMDLMTDPHELLEVAGHNLDADAQRRLIEVGRQRAQAFGEDDRNRLWTFIQSVITRVDVAADEISICISPAGLSGVLIGDRSYASDEAVTVTAAARLQRNPIGNRMVISSPDQEPANHNPALIKAVARAQVWFEQLATGQEESIRAIADRDGHTERYVGRMIRLAFLSPELVNMILAGGQPEDLTIETLWKEPPLEWADQRTSFGCLTK